MSEPRMAYLTLAELLFRHAVPLTLVEVAGEAIVLEARLVGAPPLPGGSLFDICDILESCQSIGERCSSDVPRLAAAEDWSGLMVGKR